jgi:hypothetical protein
VSNKLVGVAQAKTCSSNAPRLDLHELVTNANIHRDFTTFCAMFHIFLTYVLRVTWNTMLDNGSMEHLGETLFMVAVGGCLVILHLTMKRHEELGF